MKLIFRILHFTSLLVVLAACAPAPVPMPTATPATVATGTAVPGSTAAAVLPIAAAVLSPTPLPPTVIAGPESAPMPTPVATPATPTPVPVTCQPSLVPTIAQTEGPMYLANPPQRANFREDARNAGGEPVTLAGRVMGTDCRPIANARVDVWHTDARGAYDMTPTYTSRGYVLTDSEGRYQFETIVPGIYTGRTAHIHVKVTPPGGRTLTTQLYFPNEATNAGDAIFDHRLLVKLEETPQGKRATFDFVVAP